MKKLTLAIALAALFAANVFAQTAGEDHGVKAAPATSADKAAAKQSRKAEGQAATKSAKSGDADPSSMGKAHTTTKAERKLAAEKRKAAGTKAVKEPKDPSSPAS